ncbi:lipid asymmetry maintenance protein MlaB [Psychromonas sp. KJ10-10]|uniref:STAS domain-containing protein n=1 Tax=Psychromonas sp. KJ10-10 TaxID=3391823 RepID=UPI0039B47B66
MSELREITGNLVLSELSKQKFPHIKTYLDIKKIDLQGVKTIDSAGIAYLAQIKSTHSNIQFVNITEKISVLSELYGIDFLFTERGFQ